MPKLDPTSPTYRDDFQAAHGAFVYDPHSFIKYFPDGARVTDASSAAYAMYHEPPEKPLDLWTFVVRYWKLKKGIADKAFATLKNELTYSVDNLLANTGGNLPTPPKDSEIERLKQLAETCRSADAQLADAERELANAKLNPTRAEADRIRLGQHRAFQDAVRAIRV
jgi:hypothetical protein